MAETEQTEKQPSGSNRETDKKSSTILIYLYTDIYTERGGIIKTEWKGELIKNWG